MECKLDNGLMQRLIGPLLYRSLDALIAPCMVIV